MIVLVPRQWRAPALDRIGKEHRRRLVLRPVERLAQRLEALAAEIVHQLTELCVSAFPDQRGDIPLIENGQVFYGTSFITDETGEVVCEFGRKEEGVLIASFDLDKIDQARAAWGFFRDRRTDLYDILI